MTTATAEKLEAGAYYTDGFTLYFIEKIGPSGTLVDIENCFLQEGPKVRDVRALPKLQRVIPAEK